MLRSPTLARFSVAVAVGVAAAVLPSLAAPAAAAAVPVTASAAAPVVLQVPFPCGERWRGSNGSPRHVAPKYEIDFNLAGTSGSQDEGRTVLAAAAGTVVMSQFRTTDGFGELVKIRHADGSHTLYAHLKKGTRAVRAGDTVRQGQRVGALGGTTRGGRLVPHLHFEHRRGSSQRTLQAVSFDGKRFGYPVQTVTSRNSCAGKPGTGPAGGHTAAADLDGRLVPDPARHDKPDLYRANQPVDVVCRAVGKSAYGSSNWALTGDHLYVPAAILRHGDRRGIRPGTPDCRTPLPLAARTALDGRAAKDKASESVVDLYKAGDPVPVVCTAYGKETYNGHDTWARTEQGKWVAREFLDAPGHGLIRGVPRCDLEPTGPEGPGDGSHGDPGPGDGAREPVSALAPSTAIVEFIKRRESFRDRPYNDKGKGGVCTVGWGHALVPHHTCTAAEKARAPITRAEGERILRGDIAIAARRARSLVPSARMHQHEFDAITSMTFNLGGTTAFKVKRPDGTRVDTEFLKALKAGPARWHEIPKRMERFVYDDGEYLCGLHRRRIAEGAVFARADYHKQVPESACTDR
jgi:GH24 family phage-related lysozyme (muramidase)